MQKRLALLISTISSILFFGACFYLTAHFFVYLNEEYSIIDKVFSGIVLILVLFWGVHCVGYVDHLLKSILIYRPQSINRHLKNPEPEVAIFIPVLNEEPKIVEATIAEASLINYKNYEIFLLDDSTDDVTRKALMNVCKKFNINCVHRGNRRGFKAGAINDAIENLEKNTKYLLILDADHRPIPTVLNEIVPLLEEDNTLAFIQTPQHFSIKTKNRLARSYSFQEHVFHKHVCRGKDVNNATFMGGTNLIVRLSYLKEIGGFDETNITEDVATSLIFHSHGYNTVYLDKVYAEGLPPSSLAAYHTQRMRYAYGGIQNFKKVLKMLFTCPHSLRIGQWWEYLLSGSWYFLIWTQLLLMIYPIVIILFGIQPCASIFLFVFITFIAMTGCQIFTSMRERGYRITDLLMAQALFFSTFPVYVRASIYALIGKKIDFIVTSKGKVRIFSFIRLWPQIFMLVLLSTSIIVGIWRVLIGQLDFSTYVIIFWATYNAVLLSFTFYFFFEDIKKLDLLDLL